MCLHLLGSGFGVYKDYNVEIGMGTKNSGKLYKWLTIQKLDQKFYV